MTLDFAIILFVGAAAVVAVAGIWVTGVADRLADRTGLGEAIVGGLLIGMVTSLAGMVVSVTAALDGRASLAFSNGVGGIAAQTAFLALADLIYRKANLEHAAASLTSLFQCGLLIAMLSLPLIASTTPEITILGIHPMSLLLLGLYALGVRISILVRKRPMWQPVETENTHHDEPDEAEDDQPEHLTRLWLQFIVLGMFLASAGWGLALAGSTIADISGISESFVGALMTAVATSLPELVTTLAAIRRGALQLAIGGIIGGNTFDVLFLSLSDIFYPAGTLYHTISNEDVFWVSVSILMSAVLLIGLIVRQVAGPLRIGFESLCILTVYLGAILAVSSSV